MQFKIRVFTGLAIMVYEQLHMLYKYGMHKVNFGVILIFMSFEFSISKVFF